MRLYLALILSFITFPTALSFFQEGLKPFLYKPV
ncbi:hypothetical protein PANA5342_2501 [Pantoea ananatis LMG 5342]|nr:hypothetical protein PANA5342_2501 [Pantoea ananatis LMG 5342]